MRRIVILISFFALIACSGSKKSSALHSEDQTLLHLKTNLEFLASDHLQGRETTSLTNYIAETLLPISLNSTALNRLEMMGHIFKTLNLKLKNGTAIQISL